MKNIIAAILAVSESAVKKIREEKELQDNENHEKLNQDNDPEIPPGGHVPEPFVIK